MKEMERCQCLALNLGLCYELKKYENQYEKPSDSFLTI